MKGKEEADKMRGRGERKHREEEKREWSRGWLRGGKRSSLTKQDEPVMKQQWAAYRLASQIDL